MKNSHRIRKQVDDPNGFWLHIFKELNWDIHRVTGAAKDWYRQHHAGPDTADPDDLIDGFVIIQGKHGWMTRKAMFTCAEKKIICEAPPNTEPHVWDFDSFPNENGSNARNGIRFLCSYDEMLSAVHLDTLMVPHRWSRVIDYKTRQISDGLVIGEPLLTYSTLLMIRDKDSSSVASALNALEVKQLETKENGYNQGKTSAFLPLSEDRVIAIRNTYEEVIDALRPPIPSVPMPVTITGRISSTGGMNQCNFKPECPAGNKRKKGQKPLFKTDDKPRFIEGSFPDPMFDPQGDPNTDHDV